MNELTCGENWTTMIANAAVHTERSTMSDKKLRVFISNPESGEPWAIVGDYDAAGDKAKVMQRIMGEFVHSEMQGLMCDGDSAAIEIKLKAMTDEEVEALPDI